MPALLARMLAGAAIGFIITALLIGPSNVKKALGKTSADRTKHLFYIILGLAIIGILLIMIGQTTY